MENWVYADDSEHADLKLIDFGFSVVFSADTPMTKAHGTLYYVSPEVLSGPYDEKCDVWSIGVIAHMLLSGSPPFNGKDDREIIEAVQEGKVKLSGHRWVDISHEAKDFIRKLLTVSPKERPSCGEALRHPWVERVAHLHDPEIDIEVLNSLRSFASQNLMKRAACSLLAFSRAALHVTHDEISALEAQFRLIDTEGHGTILLNELTAVLQKYLQVPANEAEALFNRLDQTGDHEISYSEFLAAAMQWRLLQQESALREVFSRFDADHNGVITAQDLHQVLGDQYTGEEVEHIVEAADFKHNGQIDFDEFVQACTGATTGACPDTCSSACAETKLDRPYVVHLLPGRCSA